MTYRKIILENQENAIAAQYGASYSADTIGWDDKEPTPLAVKAVLHRRHGGNSGKIHYLKVDEGPMNDLLTLKKKAEIRKNDRDYHESDLVFLQDAQGRTATRKITHIQTGYGIADGYAVLSYADRAY